MRQKALFAGIVFALAGVGNVLAAPPPSISGLQAELRDGGSIAISWDEPEDADIAYYRVYYSSESILVNNGTYDDFEQTDGPKELYVFETAPTVDRLFVSVLGVNSTEEESEFFTEEVSITLPSSVSPTLIPTSEPPAEEEVEEVENVTITDPGTQAPPEGDDEEPEEAISEPPADIGEEIIAPTEPVSQELVELLKAAAVSSTGVVLTFSSQVDIDSAEVRNAFHISTAEGDTLLITKLLIRGAEVHVETSDQKPESVYSVTISEPLRGVAGQGIDTVARSSFFKGFKPEKETVVVADQSILPNDITDVKFASEETSPGVYQVSISWNRGALTQPVAQYIVSQSLDKGETISEPFTIPGNAFPLDIEDVPTGEFGVYIRVVDGFGRITPGVFETTTIPVPESEIVPVTEETDGPPVVEEPPEDEVVVKEWDHTDDLTDAGATFVILSLTMTGTVVGWRHGRKPNRNKKA